MNITVENIVTTKSPYATINGLMEITHKKERFTREIVAGLKKHLDRYGRYAVIGEGRTQLINILAFTDYYTYRTELGEKNLAKNVPPYDPHEIAWSLGFYGPEPGTGTEG